MRVLLPAGVADEGARYRVSEEEGHHLRVRRAEEGELVELRDGAGLVGTGRLIQSRDGVGGRGGASATGGETRAAHTRRRRRATGSGSAGWWRRPRSSASPGWCRWRPNAPPGWRRKLRPTQHLAKLRRHAAGGDQADAARAWAAEIDDPVTIDGLIRADARRDATGWPMRRASPPGPAGRRAGHRRRRSRGRAHRGRAWTASRPRATSR